MTRRPEKPRLPHPISELIGAYHPKDPNDLSAFTKAEIHELRAVAEERLRERRAREDEAHAMMVRLAHEPRITADELAVVGKAYSMKSFLAVYGDTIALARLSAKTWPGEIYPEVMSDAAYLGNVAINHFQRQMAEDGLTTLRPSGPPRSR